MDKQRTDEIVIPINAEVRCTDGACGRSICVLVNPVSNKVTHMVVRDADAPHTEFIVSVDQVVETSTEWVQLRCASNELRQMARFVKTEFDVLKTPMILPAGYGVTSFSYGSGAYMFWPYVIPQAKIPVEHEQIPAGDLVIRRGTRVEATDGYVGHVDEFLVHPDTGNISHLVMREGHLWGQKDVSIPVSAIRETREPTVYLNLDKQQVESLPTIPIHRG